jgi:hypothetical protein
VSIGPSNLTYSSPFNNPANAEFLQEVGYHSPMSSDSGPSMGWMHEPSDALALGGGGGCFDQPWRNEL